ncbi:MAG: nitroreductase family protein [Muribaculaceae bacterium]|nr:nitroreductase family protein [Muribaculaceae bacterium]
MKNIAERNDENIVMKNILTRTSDRLFDATREVSKNQIEQLLHAAMAAPSGVNRQPWHFYVVTDKTLLAQLADSLPYCKMAKDAAAAIVSCGDSKKFLEGVDDTLWVQDLSAASENILLAANSLDLGSVWTALYPHSDRMEKVKQLLKIDDTFVPFNVIPIGYVLTPHKPLDKWNPANITYLE